MSEMRIFVTGATGMVGFHLVEHLTDRGLQVTAMVRAASDTQELRTIRGAERLRLVVAELGDTREIARLMSGHDVVVHAAGVVDPHGRRAEVLAVNVQGTRSVLEAAAEAGVRQFVQISSLSVITNQSDRFGATEETPLNYCGEAYADSKVDAEKLVMCESGRGRIQVTALRPGFIYGPKERAWMPRLISSLSSGKVMLIDGGRRETNVIYIGNLVRAIESALLNSRAFGQVYNLTDGERVTKKQLFDAICRGLALPPVTRSIPRPVARVICETVSAISPFLPDRARRNLSRFSRAAFRLAAVNQGFDITKAERDLNYTDRIPFEEGMRRTLDWFRNGSAAGASRLDADAGDRSCVGGQLP